MVELQYFTEIQDIMLQSGQLIMGYFKSDVKIFEKKDGNSLFTNVDLENEAFLKSELAKIVPQAGFLAEESGFSGNNADYMWVIDALDGTRNFIKEIPHFCIMVALTYKGEPIVSAIYQPITKELYYAEKGKGLWLNGAMQVTFVDQLREKKTAMVVCKSRDWAQIKLKLAQHHIQLSHRYFGCAGMDAIYLVRGNIDYMSLTNISWWDIAAGMLCIHEAGNLFSSYEKNGADAYKGDFIAGNQLFFENFDDKSPQNL